jgi:hypothetical protein
MAIYVAFFLDKYNFSFDDIGYRFGDRIATVKRLYRGYKLLQQAESRTRFSREDIVRNRFYFSHLYTAADQPEFQKFLGITPEHSLRLNPVPASHLKHLSDLMTWVYGSKSRGIQPLVQSQNPDLNILRQVISEPRGLAALRAGLSLERANEISIGDEKRFRDALTRAKEDLLQAKATVTTGYFGEADLYQTIDQILQVATSIQREMEATRKTAKPSHSK